MITMEKDLEFPKKHRLKEKKTSLSKFKQKKWYKKSQLVSRRL